MHRIEIKKPHKAQKLLTKFGFSYLGIFVALIFFSQSVFGEIRLPSIISDNMVLQQQSGVPLWGNATANHKVSVVTSWNHKQYTTQSDADGKWKVKVQTPRAGGPYTITFDDGDKLIIKNVMIGEVWICSGQSNMEMALRWGLPVLNSNEILMNANEPQLRLFLVPSAVSNTPLYEGKGSWKVSSPESASAFSAVGFQFAKKLQQLLKVPVGIIEAAIGGTPINAWMDRESLRPFPQVEIPLPDNDVKVGYRQPTCLYNGMIHPIAGYGIKGFLWYQGEYDRRNPGIYKDLMVAMVNGWRRVWQNDSLPFYYVQIAPYNYRSLQGAAALIREAQAEAAKVIPHSGMVVSIGAGDKNTVHPPDKTTIANRLLYWALGDAYHWKGIAYQSPSFESMKIKDDTVIVSFDHAPYGLTSYFQEIKGFELAGKDKEFYPAEALITEKAKIIVHSDQVPQPVAVRYLFKDWATGNLYNIAGLPAGPFRTDNW